MEMLSSSHTWIGVVVAVAGNITISLALNCQKLAHTRLQKAQHKQSATSQHSSNGSASTSQDGSAMDSRPSQGTQQESHLNGASKQNDRSGTDNGTPNGQNGGGMDTMFLHSKLWWLGLALMTLGEAGNFISYGFAPASLVAPLGAVALLSNVIISPILLGERFKLSDVGGILLAIIGAVTVVFSSKQNDARLDPSQLLHAIKRLEFIIYAAISVAAATLLAFLSTTSLGDRWVLIDVGTCAIFGGFTVLSTKGISSLISGGQPIVALKFPITYGLVIVLAATAVVQITYLNRALQRFDSREVIPTKFVFFTISAIVGSAILYRDFENMDAHRLINFLFGCLTTFAGVFVLTWRHHGSQADTHVHEEHDEEASDDAQEEVDDEAGEPTEAEPLLSHSWHGSESGRGRISSPGRKTRQRIDFLEPAFEDAGPSHALRMPTHAKPSLATRPRSRTNSPHKATSRLSGSFDRSSGLSRSASNQPSALGMLSSSSSAGLRTPKLSLMSMDRPTGLSPGHYLLLATPPPSFTLNPVFPGASGAARSGLGKSLATQYGAIGNKSGPAAFLPFPVTMASGSGPGQSPKRLDQGRVDGVTEAQQRPNVSQPAAAATAAESIVSPVAETSAVDANEHNLSSSGTNPGTPSTSRPRAGSISPASDLDDT